MLRSDEKDSIHNVGEMLCHDSYPSAFHQACLAMKACDAASKGVISCRAQ
jgi:hypothetical protein